MHTHRKSGSWLVSLEAEISDGCRPKIQLIDECTGGVSLGCEKFDFSL